jgi:predicted Rossmann-fold nucleotide-binding protein
MAAEGAAMVGISVFAIQISLIAEKRIYLTMNTDVIGADLAMRKFIFVFAVFRASAA